MYAACIRTHAHFSSAAVHQLKCDKSEGWCNVSRAREAAATAQKSIEDLKKKMQQQADPDVWDKFKVSRRVNLIIGNPSCKCM